jgi:hypothetical protein
VREFLEVLVGVLDSSDHQRGGIGSRRLNRGAVYGNAGRGGKRDQLDERAGRGRSA